MLDDIKRVAGIISVEEKGNYITIVGVKVRWLMFDIQRYWTTSKISMSMFTEFTSSRIKIPTFFAVELLYVAQALLEVPRTRTTKSSLRLLIKQLKQQTWLMRLDRPVEPWLNWGAMNEIAFSLLPHQREFLQTYEVNKPRYGLNGFLLFAPPGSGKSISDVSVALGVNATKVIIVCPKNATYNVWEKTLMKEMKTPQHPFIADRDKGIEPKKKWHIFHYETLDRALELISHWNVDKEEIVIVLDESHNFNDINSLRTDRFVRLCKDSKSSNIIWASGTPIKALGFEAIPLLRTIDPLFNERTENSFKRMYGRDAKRTLDILKHRLGIVSYTVPKTNIMSDKPIQETIRIEMPNSKKYLLSTLAVEMKAYIDDRMTYFRKIRPEYTREFNKMVESASTAIAVTAEQDAMREYLKIIKILQTNEVGGFEIGQMAMITNKVEKEIIMPRLREDARKRFKDIKAIVKYPLLKARGECLGRILTKERVQCHIDMLQHIDFPELIESVEKKTIIFTSHVKVIDACYDVITALKYKSLRVYGATNNELPQMVAKFDKDPAINPLLATFQSLSTAVPLTMANGIIMLNSPWRTHEREQAIARAHRIGQDKPVYVFDIILDTGEEPNISSRSIDILEWSRQQVEAITGIGGAIEVSLEYNGTEVNIGGDISDLAEDLGYEDTDGESKTLEELIADGDVEVKPYVDDPEDKATGWSFVNHAFQGDCGVALDERIAALKKLIADGVVPDPNADETILREISHVRRAFSPENLDNYIEMMMTIWNDYFTYASSIYFRKESFAEYMKSRAIRIADHSIFKGYDCRYLPVILTDGDCKIDIQINANSCDEKPMCVYKLMAALELVRKTVPTPEELWNRLSGLEPHVNQKYPCPIDDMFTELLKYHEAFWASLLKL